MCERSTSFVKKAQRDDPPLIDMEDQSAGRFLVFSSSDAVSEMPSKFRLQIQTLYIHALNALTSDERELLMLAGWEGLSAAQMGRDLGCSPISDRVRLQRARARPRTTSDAWEPLGSFARMSPNNVAHR